VEGLAEAEALLDRFEAVSARFAEDLSEAEMDALVAEQGELQEGIDRPAPEISTAPSRSQRMRCTGADRHRNARARVLAGAAA
jgi:hypothetical protein